MSLLNEIELMFVFEDKHIYKTFDVTTSLKDIEIEIIEKELYLEEKSYDVYYNGELIENAHELTIQDTTITDENRCIDIVFSEVYKSFLNEKNFDGEFQEYLYFLNKCRELEELSAEIERGPIGRYSANPESFFKLKTLILYSYIRQNESHESIPDEIYKFIDEKSANEYSEYNIAEDDSYIVTNPEFMFKDNMEGVPVKTSLEVLAELKNIETLEWKEIYSDRLLKIRQTSELGIMVNFVYSASMSFIQYEDLYVFIARHCHYACLMHNGYHDYSEDMFKNGSYIGYCRRGKDNVFDDMKTMCTSFFSYEENPLFDALNERDLDKARSVLPDYIESLNPRQIPPLLIAARIGYIDAVKLLLEFTEDPEKEYEEYGTGSKKTLRSCAMKSGNQELIKYINSIGP